jgi:hypothetical protein
MLFFQLAESIKATVHTHRIYPRALRDQQYDLVQEIRYQIFPCMLRMQQMQAVTSVKSVKSLKSMKSVTIL